MSNVKSKLMSKNAFVAGLQQKIEDESVTASVINSQMSKTNDKLAFERAMKGCVTRSEWFSIYEKFSEKAMKYARENNFFSVLLDSKNAYESAIFYAFIEACAHENTEKLVCRLDNYATASPYSFFVNSCKVNDFKAIPNRETFKRALLWKVVKGFGKNKPSIANAFERDGSGNYISHDGSTQCDYVLRVLVKLGSMKKNGAGSSADFVWINDSVVTKALRALAE